MKAMKLTGIRQMEMMEVEAPRIIRNTDVLIKMKSLGVCGSDIHYYTTGRIGSQIVQYPFTVGHEGAGEVQAVGPEVSSVKPGDRIAIEPAMPCWECDQCKAGRPHTCRKLKFLGCPGQAEGCLSEYIVMPETSCFRIDESMSFDQASLMEPLSIGVYAVDLYGKPENASVAILGFGPIGMSVMLAALTGGARNIFVTDKIHARLDMADRSGATGTGNPDEEDVVSKCNERLPEQADVIFECCGQQEAADQAIAMLKPGGTLMIVGIPEFDRWSFEADLFRRKEIRVQNVRRQNHSVEKTHQLLIDKKVKPDTMITHTFNFKDSKAAFDLVAAYGDGVMKAMIHF